jgi:guanylate kinase
MLSDPRQLYVISGPSGVGKTSLTRALVAGRSDLVLSVSYTTRPPRSGETGGVNYHFVDAGAFAAMAARGAFLEHAQVFGHAYGTARETVETALADGRGVVLEIDWQGAAQVRRAWPSAVLVMIVPPSVESLRARLSGRGDGDSAVERRMRTALAELGHWREFDYLVVNDRFGDALADLAATVRAGALTRAAREPWLRAALPELFGGPEGGA